MKTTRVKILRVLAACAALGMLGWSLHGAVTAPPAVGNTTGTAAAAAPVVAAPKPSVGYLYDQTPLDRSNRERLTSYADMLEKVTPSVVSVYTSSRVVRAARGGRGRGGNANQSPVEEGVGSGSIITADGYILTNHHVISTEDANGERPADTIVVKLADGREFNAKYIGSDKSSDVGLIKIEGKNLPTLKLADSTKLRVGDVVFAVGNPMDVGLTVTQGIVSATGRSHLDLLEDGFEDFIQTDASINPGNSGGPLVDANGRLIGLNSAILSPSFRPVNMGIGFAVPSFIARHVVDSLVRDGRVKRGILGVNLQSVDHELSVGLALPSSRGALVTEVRPSTPAEAAGLVRGDMVLKLNSEDIDSSGKLRYLVSMTAPGETVTLSLMRDGQPRTLKARVGDRDEFLKAQEAQPARYVPVSGRPRQPIADVVAAWIAGASVLGLDNEVRAANGIPPDVKGTMLVEFSPESPLNGKIPEGAVIVEANKKPVASPAELQTILKPGAVNVFYIYYRGGYGYAAATLPAAN